MGLHVALTPTWSETAAFADYVLPMGHARRAPRHPEPGDALGTLGELPPARAARGPRAHGGDLRQHARGQSRARSGRRTSSGSTCPGGSTRTARSASGSYFESPYEAGRKLTVARVLPLDLRELGARPARGGGPGGPVAPRVHAALRRLPHREGRARACTRSRESCPPGATTDPATGIVSEDGKALGVSDRRAGRGRLPDPLATPRDLLAHPAASGAGPRRRCPGT